MPHTTLITTPEILCRLVRLHAACTRRIDYAVAQFEEGTVPLDEAISYASDIRQAESIARVLKTPLRKNLADSKTVCASGGYTGVFQKELGGGDFVIEEHCMTATSPRHELMNQHIGSEADGWKLIAIKF